MNTFFIGVTVGIAYCWVVDLAAKRRRRRIAARRAGGPPPIVVCGIENLDREPRATRLLTIGGQHFVAMDDYVDLILDFAGRMDVEGRHDRARGARDVAAHLGGWALELDIEAVEKSR